MTALNYVLHDQCVMIAMDSLVLDEGKAPRGFCSKLFPLPHLRGVMCATGVLQFALDWFAAIQLLEVPYESVVALDAITQSRLLDITPEHDSEGKPYGTTVYQFGYDADAKRFRGFAYQSPEFQSQELRPNVPALKPKSDEAQRIFTESYGKKDTADAFVEAIRQQKLEDEAKPPSERVGIGGEVHLVVLTLEGQYMVTCHRFEDYESSYAQIRRRLGLH